MVPIMAIAFDYAVEMTYPIGQSYSTGMLISSGTIFGNTYTLICGQIIE